MTNTSKFGPIGNGLDETLSQWLSYEEEHLLFLPNKQMKNVLCQSVIDGEAIGISFDIFKVDTF